MIDNKNWIRIVLNCITILLVGTNGFLVFQNISLRKSISRAPIYATEPGFKFPTLDLRDLDGNIAALDFNSQRQKTLLLHFSTNCEYCTQAYPHWKSLLSKLDKNEWRIVGITRQTDGEKIKAHLASFGLQDLEVRSIKLDDATKCRIGYTPMVIAINGDGEVDRVWTGLWRSGDMSLILQDLS